MRTLGKHEQSAALSQADGQPVTNATAAPPFARKGPDALRGRAATAGKPYVPVKATRYAG
jgi:hypothetical protein